jgi:hypothetical protein
MHQTENLVRICHGTRYRGDPRRDGMARLWLGYTARVLGQYLTISHKPFSSESYAPPPQCLLFKISKIKTKKATILLFVLCGCKMWCLALRKEQRFWVSKKSTDETNVFWPMREDVIRSLRERNIDELQNIIFFTNYYVIKSKSITWPLNIWMVWEN